MLQELLRKSYQTMNKKAAEDNPQHVAYYESLAKDQPSQA